MDANQDGWPDIYVANDQKANFLWINQENGRFIDEAVQRGCALDNQGREQAGMGIAIDDIDRNRWEDIVVTHFPGEYNACYMGQLGIFQDKAMQLGIGQPSYPYTGFGTAFADLDCDADMDLVVVNGAVGFPRISLHTELEKNYEFARYAEPNLVHLNENGKFVRFVATSSDPLTTENNVARALCVGDVDQDGKVDLLLTRLQKTPLLLRNVSTQKGGFLEIEAVLPQFGGRHDYNAYISVVCSETEEIRHSANPGGSYLSSHSPVVHFGLGESKPTLVKVEWFDGKVESFDVSINQKVKVQYGTGQPVVSKSRS